MSFEGRVRALCAKGHFGSWDVYADEPTTCGECHEPFVWRETVDDTNGEGFETPLIEVEPAATCKCHCGHRRAIGEPRYAIPEKP